MFTHNILFTLSSPQNGPVNSNTITKHSGNQIRTA